MIELRVAHIPGVAKWRHILPVWAGTVFIKERCNCGGRVKRRHVIGFCVYTRHGGYMGFSQRLMRRYSA